MSIIQIFLHGLIALVPAVNSGGPSDSMTALLVDASKQPTGYTQCFVAHKPTLSVHAEPSACVQAHCNPTDLEICTCDLERKEVVLPEALPPTKKREPFRTYPQGALPFDSIDARDLSFVANLSHMGYELDPQYLASVPPKNLIARMTFSFESIDACSLGTLSDEASENVHPLSLRPLNESEKAGDPSQAMAQLVAASFNTGQELPQVILKDLDNGSSASLFLLPTGGVYRIELMNTRVSENGAHADLPSDHPCDDGVERDFAFFYDLAKNPPTWEKRPVPHIKYTRWKSVNDLKGKTACEQYDHAPNSHPICAMATFITTSTAEE
jgi:hypothetical protein